MLEARDGRLDVHHSWRRLANATRLLKKNPSICGEGKRRIFGFQARLGANGLTPSRRLFYIQHLTRMALMLNEPFIPMRTALS